MFLVQALILYLFSVSLLVLLLLLITTEYCAGGKIEKNEVGGACGAYEGGERGVQGSGGETCGKETTGETQT